MTLYELRDTDTYSEIVQCDVYGLRTLSVRPTFILDVGANIGCFSLYAATLFPEATLLAIEPDPENYKSLCANLDGKSHLSCLNVALGTGPVYYRHNDKSVLRGYNSPSSPGFDTIQDDVNWIGTEIQSVTIDQLIPRDCGEYLIKIDCEGAEACIIGHKPSMDILQRSCMVTAELHFYQEHAVPAPLWDNRELAISNRMCLAYNLSLTHDVQLKLWSNGAILWAMKRSL